MNRLTSTGTTQRGSGILPLASNPNRSRIGRVKVADDYQAKIRLWAANPQVVPLPPFQPLPKFSPQKFRTHVEMNAWKQQLILQMAREAGKNG